MQGQIDTVEDDFWTEHRELFTAQFPSYYTKPQKVRGRFHMSEEKYSASTHEIIPISEKQGTRTYVMMRKYSGNPSLPSEKTGLSKKSCYNLAHGKHSATTH